MIGEVGDVENGVVGGQCQAGRLIEGGRCADTVGVARNTGARNCGHFGVEFEAHLIAEAGSRPGHVKAHGLLQFPVELCFHHPTHGALEILCIDRRVQFRIVRVRVRVNYHGSLELVMRPDPNLSDLVRQRVGNI